MRLRLLGDAQGEQRSQMVLSKGLVFCLMQSRTLATLVAFLSDHLHILCKETVQTQPSMVARTCNLRLN